VIPHGKLLFCIMVIEICMWELSLYFLCENIFLVTSFCQIIVDLMSVQMPQTLKTAHWK